jgi:GNAT superfamily N-acetyltransferase
MKQTPPRARAAAAAEPIMADQLTIVPANEASWADLQSVFGVADYPGRCYCQRYKSEGWHWSLSDEVRRERLRKQTNCGNPQAESTTGLVAYLGTEPVGWVAVDRRADYPKLLRSPGIWRGRQEDKADDSVWAVTCLVTRKGYRKRGITYALAAATVGYARSRGARAIEAYPIRVPPGKEVTWGDLHVGHRDVFADAGFAEVCRPSARRVVMRIDFTPQP